MVLPQDWDRQVAGSVSIFDDSVWVCGLRDRQAGEALVELIVAAGLWSQRMLYRIAEDRVLQIEFSPGAANKGSVAAVVGAHLRPEHLLDCT